MKTLTLLWLARRSEIQFGAALFEVLLMLMLPISRAPANLTTSRSAMLVANATILVASGAIDRFAEFQIRRSLFDPEIRRLAGYAKWSPEPGYYNSLKDLPPTQLSIAVFASVVLSLIATTSLVGTAAWLWQVPVGLAISEAIYLAWAFEGLLMKAELEAIARRWTRVQASRARAQAQFSAPESSNTNLPPTDGQPAVASAAASEPKPDIGWIDRARYLLTELRRHRFEITTPVQTS